MNYRIMQLVRDLESAIQTLRTAVHEGKDTAYLLPLGKAMEKKADILARAIKDLQVRGFNPCFQQAHVLANNGWQVTAEGNNGFQQGSLISPAGQHFRLEPSAIEYDALVILSGKEAGCTLGNHIPWTVIRYLQDLTLELDRNQLAPANAG